MTKHLAILQQPYIDLILSGQKTIESRFSLNKILPYGAVKSGDVILMKESGGKVLGEFCVEKVDFYKNLTPQAAMQLMRRFKAQLCLDDDFIQRKQNSRFATLMHITKSVRYPEPYDYPKRDMRGWVILKEDIAQTPLFP